LQESGTVSVTARGKISKGSIILPEPLPLPDGSDVIIHIEPVSGEGQAVPLAPPADLKSLPFFGMWSDREDMSDGRDWVKSEREAWRQRLVRRD
jgi:hypothetical protein